MEILLCAGIEPFLSISPPSSPALLSHCVVSESRVLQPSGRAVLSPIASLLGLSELEIDHQMLEKDPKDVNAQLNQGLAFFQIGQSMNARRKNSQPVRCKAG